MKLLGMLLRSYVFLIARRKNSELVWEVHRSLFCRAHFRVDLPRRRRTAGTRIAYESSRWTPPVRSSRGFPGRKQLKRGGDDDRVPWGELVCQFLPAYPTTGNDHCGWLAAISVLAIIDFYNFPCPPLSRTSHTDARISPRTEYKAFSFAQSVFYLNSNFGYSRAKRIDKKYHI